MSVYLETGYTCPVILRVQFGLSKHQPSNLSFDQSNPCPQVERSPGDDVLTTPYSPTKRPLLEAFSKMMNATIKTVFSFLMPLLRLAFTRSWAKIPTDSILSALKGVRIRYPLRKFWELKFEFSKCRSQIWVLMANRKKARFPFLKLSPTCGGKFQRDQIWTRCRGVTIHYTLRRSWERKFAFSKCRF